MPHQFPGYRGHVPRQEGDGSRKVSAVDAAIGERVSSLRRMRRLSAAALAAWLKLPLSLLFAYEAGAERIPAATLIAIAQALDIGIADIYGGLRR